MASFSREKIDGKHGEINGAYNDSSGLNGQKREAAALLHVAAQKPVLVIADTNHLTGDANRILNNPSLMKGLADQGKRDVFIELPQKAQPMVDSFYRDEISRAQMSQNFKDGFKAIWQSKEEAGASFDQLANGIELAKANGIKIHLADRMPPVLSENPEGKEVYFKAREMYGSGASKEDTLAYLHENFPGGKEGFDEFDRRLTKERNDVDALVADDVKSALGKSGGGAVVIYGAMHFEKKNDMNELIGKDRCASVSLYHDDKARKEDKEIGPKADDTDYDYMRSSKQLELTDAGRENGMPPLSRDAENAASPTQAPRAPAPSVKPERDFDGPGFGG